MNKKKDGCTFYEGTHTYKYKGEKLTSVTTFLGKYFGPFDADKIAKIKAWQSKRQGRKGEGVRYWKAQWKKSAEDGTKVHNKLEAHVKKKGVEDHVLEDALEAKFNFGKEWVEKYLGTLDEPDVVPELLIFNGELKIAGQIDLLVKRDGKIDLIDYKTNKAIHKTGYKNKKCKEPIGEMQDCSFTKYTLQLSMYAYMLEQEGYSIGDLILLHLTPDGAVPMFVKYRKDLIEKLLKDKEENDGKEEE